MSGLETGTILAIAGGIGTAVQAVGALSQANAQASAQSYNAAALQQQARDTELAAAENERRFREDMRRVQGSQSAAIGASGVAREGSPLEVLEDSAASMELDALTIRHQGLLDSRYLSQQAAFERDAAKRTRKSGLFNAGGILIGGAMNYGQSLIGGGGKAFTGGLTSTGYTSGMMNYNTGRMVGGV